MLFLCSNDFKTYFCTRCLNHFNHERYLKQHADKCKNEIKEGNLIDTLKITGGFSKEIRHRFLSKHVVYLKKLESELSASCPDDKTKEDASDKME
jgi:hypothetical protein